MDLDGRRTSYSIARVLEEVQEQKTKEQQLRRSFVSSELLSDLAAAGRNSEEELPFQRGFVSQLLGKFGGSAAAAPVAHVGGLAKASSVQNLATASGTVGCGGGGVLLRHPERTRVGLAGRRSSQDGFSAQVVTNGNGILHEANGAYSNSSSSPSPTLSSPSAPPSRLLPGTATVGKDRVLIIAKASAPPIVRRLQLQQQRQLLTPSASQAPVPLQDLLNASITPPASQVSLAPSAVDQIDNSANYIPIPSDTSLPIKNIVQAKRILFEKQQQQTPTQRHRNGSGGGGGVPQVAIVVKTAVQPTTHAGGRSNQPVIGRSPVTRQIVPRAVEIVPNTSPQEPAQPQATAPTKAALMLTPKQSYSVPPSPANAPEPSSAAINIKKPAPAQPLVFPASSSEILPNGDSDGYGFGLPVPQLKSSLPFNGGNLKRVQLSERSVTAMRKAGKSWFFGVDVSAAPEGTIAVKLTPGSSSATDDFDDGGYGHGRFGEDEDELTEERRAQTTVLDHLRSADNGQRRVTVDPALAAEARRLMASSGPDIDADSEVDATSTVNSELTGGGNSTVVQIRPVWKEKKKLCFKRDSALEETFEYQSEQSLIDELQITPDYLADPFDAESPYESEEDSAASNAAASSDSKVPPDDPQLGSNPRSAAVLYPTYKAKVADEFVWGARASVGSDHSDGSSSASQSTRSDATAAAVPAKDMFNGSAAPVDDPDAQWSSSATSDLLF